MKSAIFNISKILSGTVIAQLIIFGSLPIIARLYTPEEFGDYSLIVAISAMCSIIATLQLHQAIIMPKIQKNYLTLVDMVLILSVLFSVLVPLIMLIFIQVTGKFANLSIVKLIYIGLCILSSSAGMAMQALAIKLSRFKLIAVTAIVRSLIMVSIQVLFGLAELTVHGLIFGQLLADMSLTILMWLYMLGRRNIFKNFNIRRKIILLKKYKDFSTYGLMQEILSAFSQLLPLILLGHYFGSNTVGHFAFAQKIVQAPANIIGNAIRQVFTIKFYKSINEIKNLKKEYEILLYSMLGISTVIYLIASPFLASMFKILFGKNWTMAGDLAPITFLWVLISLCNVPSNILYKIMRMQNISMLIIFATAVFRVLLLIIGGVYLSAYYAVSFFYIAGILFSIIYMGYMNYQLKKLDKVEL